MMGGFGSGRTGGRPTVERTQALMLDVNSIMQWARQPAGLQPLPDMPATFKHFTWTWRRDGKPWADVEIALNIGHGFGTARLRYDIRHLTHQTGWQDDTVQLMATPCRFGGVRWW